MRAEAIMNETEAWQYMLDHYYVSSHFVWQLQEIQCATGTPYWQNYTQLIPSLSEEKYEFHVCVGLLVENVGVPASDCNAHLYMRVLISH
jgi:hypothetical protein